MAKNRQVLLKDRYPDWPPEVQNLREQDRIFVCRYVANGGNGAQAARDARYGEGTLEGKPDLDRYYRQKAYALLGRPHIKEAVIALSNRSMRMLAPKAIEAVSDILEMTHHKDRLKAASMVLDRTDPSVQKVDVQHTHKIDATKESIEFLKHLKANGAPREMLVKEFGALGLEYYESLLAKEDEAIEGEFVELPAPETDVEHDTQAEDEPQPQKDAEQVQPQKEEWEY